MNLGIKNLKVLVTAGAGGIGLEIARAFKSGDFSTPGFVHMQTVPGTRVMREKRDVITNEPRDLPLTPQRVWELVQERKAS